MLCIKATPAYSIGISIPFTLFSTSVLVSRCYRESNLVHSFARFYGFFLSGLPLKVQWWSRKYVFQIKLKSHRGVMIFFIIRLLSLCIELNFDCRHSPNHRLNRKIMQLFKFKQNKNRTAQKKAKMERRWFDYIPRTTFQSIRLGKCIWISQSYRRTRRHFYMDLQHIHQCLFRNLVLCQAQVESNRWVVVDREERTI